ncbi:hypothetical protein IFM89_000736 [Coptis chinensis]|uniref:Uncharacterized protein n=1 Tax=Coptis chinensis TaxID=261450 RepID=A0A835IV59_9MAGN|nr:hypothetical protein IFM89_000736 [Coptis chinensis]
MIFNSSTRPVYYGIGDWLPRERGLLLFSGAPILLRYIASERNMIIPGLLHCRVQATYIVISTDSLLSQWMIYNILEEHTMDHKVGESKTNKELRNNTFGLIFMHVDRIDILLITLGLLGSIGDGFGVPVTPQQDSEQSW